MLNRVYKYTVVTILVLCSSIACAQNEKLVDAVRKLPPALRKDFISEQFKDLYKRDTAIARKDVNNLMAHFANDKYLRAVLLMYKGAYLFKAAKTKDAILPVSQAEALFCELKNEEGEFEAIGHLSAMYRELNRTAEIIAIVLKKLSASSGNVKRECLLNERLGLIFKEQSNFDKSLEYFISAQEKFEVISEPDDKLKDVQITIERNIGVIYRNKNEPDKALFHLNKALALADNNHNDVLKASVLNSLGTLYRIKKDFRKAIQAYEESLKIKAETENLSGQSTTCTNLSKLYLEINNYLKAELYGLKAYEFGALAKDRLKIMNACEMISEVYERMNKRERAFPYVKRAYQLRDSVYVASIAEQSAKLEALYDSEKKKKEIELSKVKNDQLEESVRAGSRERNIILGGLCLVVLMFVFAIRSYLGKKKANNLLEEKNSLIVTQKQMVEEQHKEILDSINYAKRLQDAILPSALELNRIFSDNYFIYYVPKAIVAGDFYWMEYVDDTILIAVADCTGHGVPGAMVSLVCSNALNRSIYEYGIREPGKILDRTRELVLENFAKSGSDVKDGMDISLLSINRRSGAVKWAGANNPLWYIKDNNLNEITANKQPIGKADNYIPFTTHALDIKKGDSVFLFTDGYADQFGGPRGKKLKYKQMQEIIMTSKDNAMFEIHKQLLERFEMWKGGLEQVDDVCVIGIRV